MHHYHKLVTSCFVLAATVIIVSCGGNTKTNNPDQPKADTAVKTLTSKLTGTGHLISAWHDETIKTDKGEQIAYELVSHNNKLYIQAITFVGNDLKLDDIPPVSPSATEIKKQGDEYIGVERPEEKYKIDKAGDLQIYDSGQLVATCKKIL